MFLKASSAVLACAAPANRPAKAIARIQGDMRAPWGTGNPDHRIEAPAGPTASWPIRVPRLLEPGVVAAHGVEVGLEVAAGDIGEGFAAVAAIGDAVGAEVAERLAVAAPGAEGPCAAPERQAKRFHLACAAAPFRIAVVEAEHAMREHGLVQAVEHRRHLVLEGIAPDRREDLRLRGPLAQLG